MQQLSDEAGPNGPKVQPASSSMRTKSYFQGVKQLKYATDHSLPTSTKTKIM